MNIKGRKNSDMKISIIGSGFVGIAIGKAIVDFTLEREDLREEIERYLREIGKGGEV